MTSNYATEAQISYINGLFDQKAWSEVKGQDKFVTRAACIRLAVTWAADPAAVPGISDIATSDLVGQRVNQILTASRESAAPEHDYAWAPLTKKGATALIDWLKPLPRKEIAKAAAATPANPQPAKAVELEDGMYLLGGSYYKVQHAVHGSGKQYAKLAVITGVDANGVPVERDADAYEVSFEYAPGVVAKLSPANKLTYEQAKEFGMIYGTCCRCGRTLTDELSIALGIGPVCGGREFGGEFKKIVKAAKLELAS